LASLNSFRAEDKILDGIVPHRVTEPSAPTLSPPPKGIAPEKTKTPKMAAAMNIIKIIS